jgi:hypothetical protein
MILRRLQEDFLSYYLRVLTFCFQGTHFLMVLASYSSQICLRYIGVLNAAAATQLINLSNRTTTENFIPQAVLFKM